MINHLRRL